MPRTLPKGRQPQLQDEKLQARTMINCPERSDRLRVAGGGVHFPFPPEKSDRCRRVANGRQTPYSPLTRPIVRVVVLAQRCGPGFGCQRAKQTAFLPAPRESCLDQTTVNWHCQRVSLPDMIGILLGLEYQTDALSSPYHMRGASVFLSLQSPSRKIFYVPAAHRTLFGVRSDLRPLSAYTRVHSSQSVLSKGTRLGGRK